MKPRGEHGYRPTLEHPPRPWRQGGSRDAAIVLIWRHIQPLVRPVHAERHLQSPHSRTCRRHPAARAAGKDPDATATARSKLCGSTVTVDLKVEGERVTAFAHEVKACALGQASSSIMGRHVVGSTADELRAIRETARRILKADGKPPAGKWADLEVLEPLARLQGPPRLDPVDLRRGGGCAGPDRGRTRRRLMANLRASSGPSGDPRLSAHPVGPDRPPVPAPAVLLGIHRRGDPASWLLGRRLDRRGADLPLRTLRHLGARSRARNIARSGRLV